MIEVVSYDPGWPAAFDAEAHRLRATLGTLALRIDHNGSTSIPGLSAKPIIDIQVSVAALQPIATYRERLQAIGCTFLISDLSKRIKSDYRIANTRPKTAGGRYVANLRSYLKEFSGKTSEQGLL